MQYRDLLQDARDKVNNEYREACTERVAERLREIIETKKILAKLEKRLEDLLNEQVEF